MSDGQERVLQILSRVTKRPSAEIKAEHDLKGDLDVGSAEALDLLATLEDELGLEISEVEAARLRTVGDVLSFVTSKKT